MKTPTRHLTFNTPQRRELIRITEEVQAVVDEAGIAEGMALASAPPSWAPAARVAAEQCDGGRPKWVVRTPPREVCPVPPGVRGGCGTGSGAMGE